MSTTCYVKYLRSNVTQSFMFGGSEKDGVHFGCAHNLKCARKFGSGAEDVLVYAVNRDNNLVTYWGTTFINDPDNKPFYSLRTIEPTAAETVESWNSEDFSNHLHEVVGNFES